MKVDSLEDPSGQIGFYLQQLSEIYAEMDKEIAETTNSIEVKYQSKIDDINQLIESTRSLLQ